KVSAGEFIDDIERNERVLKKYSGDRNWKYLRYPFLHEGETAEKRRAVRSYLSEHEYKIAQVTIDFGDYLWNNPYARCKDKGDKKAIQWLRETYLQNAVDTLEITDNLTRQLFKREIPQILLLHIGAFDAEVMDAMLTAYEKKGVKFIPLSKAA